ncbi:MAG TPA: TolC family protein [Bryobacteraceae bacterium]|jgi:HAE1 family hydrophobic/amphiphilic exporter-1
MRRSLLALIVVLCCYAQTGKVQVEPLHEILLPSRVGIAGETSLTLRDVIERVLANNPDLQIARIAREEADDNVKAAAGYYDPTIGFQADRSRAVTPIASLIGGSANGKLTQSEISGNPSLSGYSPWFGGSYTLTFSNSRQQTDSTFATLNPQYPASLSLSLTQPLWRGRHTDEARYRLQVARKNTQLSAEQLRQHVIETVTQAVQAYWEVDYALQNLEVQRQAVRLAEAQRASNQRQAEQGILAPIDVVAAQTQVATFQQSLFAAQQALTAAENTLKALMLANRTDPLWSRALVTETPMTPEVVTPPLDEALRQALSSRPELSETLINSALADLEIDLNRDLTKPRVDLVSTLTAQGLAGTQQSLPTFFGGSFPITALPAALLGGYGQSIADIASGHFTTAKIGVQVSLPIRNRTAEANLAVAQAEKRRLDIVRNQVEMAVEADVRNALEQVNSARARYDAARLASRSAQEQYESEQRQFQAGTSTVFLVLQRQTDFISARSREVRARADMAESVANLDRATASVTDTYDISVRP